MFANLNLHFPTVLAFATWLATQPRPNWQPIGSTYHNTFIPNESQWRGHTSMLRMQETYEAKNWTTGPHLYLAVGTGADGIFVMTPPWLEGTHAGDCNPKRFGIEVVGDFARRPMAKPQLQLLIDAAAVLHRWASIGPDIVAHRDCMPGRTCPGDAAYAQKTEIQTRLAAALASPLPTPRYTEQSPILGSGQASAARLIAFLEARQPNDSEYQRPAIIEIVSAYKAVCFRAGVNFDLAIAQMILETAALQSFWAGRPRRNPAGIGVTGQTRPGDWPQPQPAALWVRDEEANLWRTGVSFRTWASDAIPAHIGRLLAYALPAGQGTPAQQALIDQAFSYRALPLIIRGSAPILKQLGKAHNPSGQGWADPGDDYGKHIAEIANTF